MDHVTMLVRHFSYGFRRGQKFVPEGLRAGDKDLILMIQADMTAYHEPGEPPQLGLPDVYGTYPHSVSS